MQDIKDIQRLAGITPWGGQKEYQPEGSNISITGNEKGRLQKEKGIEPGTPEWFQLWFSKPYLTGEPPVETKEK